MIELARRAWLLTFDFSPVNDTGGLEGPTFSNDTAGPEGSRPLNDTGFPEDPRHNQMSSTWFFFRVSSKDQNSKDKSRRWKLKVEKLKLKWKVNSR